jgi:hypothetical protein
MGLTSLGGRGRLPCCRLSSSRSWPGTNLVTTLIRFPCPRTRSEHLDQDDTAEEAAKGLPIPAASQLWIASGWRQARL